MNEEPTTHTILIEPAIMDHLVQLTRDKLDELGGFTPENGDVMNDWLVEMVQETINIPNKNAYILTAVSAMILRKAILH